MDIRMEIYQAVLDNCCAKENKWTNKNWEDDDYYYHVALGVGEDVLEVQSIKDMEIYNVLCISKSTLKTNETSSCTYICFKNVLTDRIFVKNVRFRDWRNAVHDLMWGDYIFTEEYLKNYCEGKRMIKNKDRSLVTSLDVVNGVFYFIQLSKDDSWGREEEYMSDALINNYSLTVWGRTMTAEFPIYEKEMWQFKETYPKLFLLWQGLTKDVTDVTEEEKNVVRKFLSKKDFDLFFGKPLYKDEEIEIRPTSVIKYLRMTDYSYYGVEKNINVRDKNGKIMSEEEIENFNEDLSALIDSFSCNHADYEKMESMEQYTKYKLGSEYVMFLESSNEKYPMVFKNTKYGYLARTLYSHKEDEKMLEKANKYRETIGRMRRNFI